MSDLAPLVVATIRDKVVDDLQEEVKGLREENTKLRDNLANCVKITGTSGIPLYAWAHIDTAVVSQDPQEGIATRNLSFENSPSHRPASAADLENAEIYVGLLKEPRSLGDWEMAVFQMVREDERGRRYFAVCFRDWRTPFQYPELRLEVGPYEADHDIGQVDSIRGLFGEAFDAPRPVVTTIKFLEFFLHEPLVEE